MADHSATFLLVTLLVLAAIVLIFAMKYFVSARASRRYREDETTLRELASRALKAQEESSMVLKSLEDRLTAIDTRLAHIEKILKEVQ